MAVATFTMEDVVNGVLDMLRFAPGRAVQIHLQSSIVQDASLFYRTMMIKYVWRDFYTVTQITIDPVTGKPIEDLTGIADRFINILAVYEGQSAQPLPFAPALVNPARFQRPAIVPTGDAAVFSIWPHKPMNCVLFTRNYQDADFELDDPVPFYKDLMVMGTALSLATKAGINLELVSLFKEQLGELIDIYRDQEIKPQYQANYHQGGVPTEWYSYDN